MVDIEYLNSFHLTAMSWLAVCFAVFLLGISKSGIKGIGIVIVVILAFVFGEKASTGILLPMLIFADIFAVICYNRHTQWHLIKKLIPPMVIGVLVGVWVGDKLSVGVFKQLISIIVIGSVVLMVYSERTSANNIPTNKLFSSFMGFLTGFTTMIGNLAGPISDIYFLAMRLPKNEFIGTAAWLFFIINVFKLPFQIFVWKTISVETVALNSVLIPAIVIGFFVGVLIVKRISNTNYRRFIIIVTAIGGLVLLFR